MTAINSYQERVPLYAYCEWQSPQCLVQSIYSVRSLVFNRGSGNQRRMASLVAYHREIFVQDKTNIFRSVKYSSLCK
jgi:hypothetical protein